jgi:GTPase Era involved in 16S rRNA processing
MIPRKMEVKSQKIHVEVDMSVTMSVRQKGQKKAMMGRKGRYVKNVCWSISEVGRDSRICV